MYKYNTQLPKKFEIHIATPLIVLARKLEKQEQRIELELGTKSTFSV